MEKGGEGRKGSSGEGRREAVEKGEGRREFFLN